MLHMQDFKQIVSELMDELPEEFFRDLSGGVIVSEAVEIPDYAQGDDLYTLGHYTIHAGMRQIIIYKGSFDRVHPFADAEEARAILRGVLRHEFRHHLEFLSGIHDASSLEAQDEREKRAYLASHPLDDRKQIERLYHDMFAAMVNKDRAVLERIHDDTFVLIHMTGLRQSKRVYIDSIMNGTLNYYSEKTDGLDIQINGNQATMIGRSRVSAAVFGGGRSTWPLQLRFTLVKKSDGWKLTSAQAATY